MYCDITKMEAIPSDITDFIDSAASKNTVEKTKYDIRRFTSFLRDENVIEIYVDLHPNNRK